MNGGEALGWLIVAAGAGCELVAVVLYVRWKAMADEGKPRIRVPAAGSRKRPLPFNVRLALDWQRRARQWGRCVRQPASAPAPAPPSETPDDS